jgi:hypothetical protein
VDSSKPDPLEHPDRRPTPIKKQPSRVSPHRDRDTFRVNGYREVGLFLNGGICQDDKLLISVLEMTWTSTNDMTLKHISITR